MCITATHTLDGMALTTESDPTLMKLELRLQEGACLLRDGLYQLRQESCSLYVECHPHQGPCKLGPYFSSFLEGALRF